MNKNRVFFLCTPDIQTVDINYAGFYLKIMKFNALLQLRSVFPFEVYCIYDKTKKIQLNCIRCKWKKASLAQYNPSNLYRDVDDVCVCVSIYKSDE